MMKTVEFSLIYTRSAFVLETLLVFCENTAACFPIKHQHQLLDSYRTGNLHFFKEMSNEKCHWPRTLTNVERKQDFLGAETKLKYRTALLSGEHSLLANHFSVEFNVQSFPPATLQTPAEPGYNLFSRFPIKNITVFKGLGAANLDEVAC